MATVIAMATVVPVAAAAPPAERIGLRFQADEDDGQRRQSEGQTQ
jgi:hypothetical protein